MTGFVPSAGAKPIWFSEGDPDVGQSSVAVPLLEAVMASRRVHCVSLLEGPALSSAVVVTVSRIPAIALVARKSEATIASSPRNQQSHPHRTPLPPVSSAIGPCADDRTECGSA